MVLTVSNWIGIMIFIAMAIVVGALIGIRLYFMLTLWLKRLKANREEK